MTFRSLRKTLALALLLSTSCAEQSSEEDVELGSSEQSLIVDQAHNNGKKGFFWLPPVVLLPAFSSGSFESRLSPVVRIDELNAQGATARTVATYTGSTSVFGEKLLRNLTAQFYTVRFNSSSANLDPAKTYRIRVFPAAGAAELGYADIDVVSNALQLLTVNRGSFTPLLKGGTLAIRFRIDKNAVDSDGDGVFDWVDNCPTVKNPPVKTTADVPAVTTNKPASCNPDLTACDPKEQPVNPAVFTQPDADGDGVGDACDCPKGYDGVGTACTDINECATGAANCNSASQVCRNTAGSFACDTCAANTHPQNGVCVANQTPCPSGYTGFVETGCVDIDECATGAASCNAVNQVCHNTPGSFSCETCPLPHYIPKDGVCFNRDTCTPGATPDGCALGSFCETNPAGFYTCAPEYGARCDCNDGTIQFGCDVRLYCGQGSSSAAVIPILREDCTQFCASHGGWMENGGSFSCIDDASYPQITCSF